MTKLKIITLLLTSFFITGCSHVTPSNVTPNETTDWQTYRNARNDFELKYPQNYFLCREKESGSGNILNISLREDTLSPEECRTSGKRIDINLFLLGDVDDFKLARNTIGLTKETSLDDITQQFLQKEPDFPDIIHSCDLQTTNEVQSITCVKKAPGEAPHKTGGIFEMTVLGIYELDNNDRVLVSISNMGGGTPHANDHAFTQKTAEVFQTIKFENK